MISSSWRQHEDPDNDKYVYTLGQHARYLHLKSELVPRSKRRYWYCDWTKHFVPSTHQNALTKNVVKEYCQPIHQYDLEDMFVGSSFLSSGNGKETSPVRTVSFRIRPDCDHIKVFGALNEAFAVVHPKHHTVLKNSDNCFQAVGADGNTPILLSAQIVTSKNVSALERCVLLRFYHVEQAHLLEEDLQIIGGVHNNMTQLREVQTPLNNKLGEACAMLQNIFSKPKLISILNNIDIDANEKENDPPIKQNISMENRCNKNDSLNISIALSGIPSPKNSTRETTRFFLEHIVKSPSVIDENFENLQVFPSLSDTDYDVLQETWPLLQRTWSELEISKCTFNTLVDEASRFGMRPCQPSLDKDFCIQLFQVSQQQMLESLRSKLDQAEIKVHNDLKAYSEFEQQVIHVMIRKYSIPMYAKCHNVFNRRDHTSDSLDVGQSPISLMQRKVHNFPWEFDDITLALKDITHTIACICLEQEYDPILHSIKVCEESVQHVFDAVEDANRFDQEDFLKKRHRQAMVRSTQQKLYLKDLIQNKLSTAPRNWNGLPKLREAVERWEEIAAQASNTDEARPESNWMNASDSGGGGAAQKRFEIPLLEFDTKFGTACLTPTKFILLSELPFFESVKVFELNKVDFVALDNHPLHRIAIMRHTKRLSGFSPKTVNPKKLIEFVQLLKKLNQ